MKERDETTTGIGGLRERLFGEVSSGASQIICAFVEFTRGVTPLYRRKPEG